MAVTDFGTENAAKRPFDCGPGECVILCVAQSWCCNRGKQTSSFEIPRQLLQGYPTHPRRVPSREREATFDHFPIAKHAHAHSIHLSRNSRHDARGARGAGRTRPCHLEGVLFFLLDAQACLGPRAPPICIMTVVSCTWEPGKASLVDSLGCGLRTSRRSRGGARRKTT